MNFVAAKTLLKKEVWRFLRVPGQTLLGPLVSTTLYFLVFAKAPFAEHARWNGQPYMSFVFPGLLFLTLSNGTLLNSSSSILFAKIQGTVVDLLSAPMGVVELLWGWVGGAVVRGLLLGVFTIAIAALFVPLGGVQWLSLFLLSALVSYVFALLGVLIGLWAENFEQVNLIPNFLLLPMSFLGGIFYEVGHLPPPFNTISLFNPMVFIVDALRGAVSGRPNAHSFAGLGILLLLAALFTLACTLCIKRGYKLRT